MKGSTIFFVLTLAHAVAAQDNHDGVPPGQQPPLIPIAVPATISPVRGNVRRRQLPLTSLLDADEIGVDLTGHAALQFHQLYQHNGHWFGMDETSSATANFVLHDGRFTGKEGSKYVTESRGLRALEEEEENGTPIQPYYPVLPRASRELQGTRRPLPELEDEELIPSDYSISIDDSRDFVPSEPNKIDILVVYTRQAMCAAAFQISTCDDLEENRQPILDIIQNEISMVNLAFALSQVNTRLNLVHTYMDPDYNEDGSDSYRGILEDLTKKDDGKLDKVHELRDEYGADLVSMMVDNGEFCGIAWLYSGEERHGFSLTSWFCNTFSFAHEIGHNMGCYHNKEVKGQQHPYANGYQHPESKYRTIMAYQCEDERCPRVPYFSNPNLDYFNNGNFPVGTDIEDCSRELERLRLKVADFRDEPSSDFPSSPPSDVPSALPSDMPSASPVNRR